MSSFKRYHKLLFFILILSASSCLKGGSDPCSLKSGNYSILCDDALSEKWGQYLHRHLSKRCEGKSIVSLNKKDDNCEKIKIEINDKLDYDYCIENNEKNLILKAKNEKTILWLIYQYIKQLANEDARFNAGDIPPAVISFETQCRNFDFEYREPFFNPNLSNGDYPGIIGTNNLETDWGIWGHNLGKVLKDDSGDAIYAKQDVWIEKEQYCFSNEETFKQIKEYIVDHYEDPSSQRFMIMPNDNKIACICELCKSHGNTDENATPAVTGLITRLAKEFPQHMFFTSAYLTTQNPSAKKMPDNSGIMISTIDLPKGIELKNAKETEDFVRKLNDWKSVTDNIYIWDYAANFDDYLTPTPVLYGLKKQLIFYKSVGVQGIFLNASGYDYSSFDDMKTFVAASLMMNCNLSVDSLCEQYLTQYYPVSGKKLSNYYLSVERKQESRKKPYNIYGGFRDILKSYLDMNEFIAFYNSMNSLISLAKGEEKEKLNKLFTAMSFTRLQLAYTQGSKIHGFATLKNKAMHTNPEITNISIRLLQHKKYKDFLRFKEADGELKDYLTNWEKLLGRMPLENQLIGESVKVLSKMDKDYVTDTYMFNDGVLGFYGDYHQGWHLSSIDDLEIQLDVQNVKDTKEIFLRFLIDERHNIHSPEKIEIIKDDVLSETITASNKASESALKTNVVSTLINVDLSDAKLVTLKIYRKKLGEKSSIACDEIQLK